MSSEIVASPSSAVIRARATILGEGGSPDPEAGVVQLQAAAEAGDADGANLMATLLASGAWIPQDWPRALDYLCRAAELGSASAQGQLTLLAPHATTWRACRDAVRLERWMTPPPRQPICEAPRVRTCAGFAPPAVCDWLVGLSRGKLKPAKMVEGYGGEARYTTNRTNSDFAFDVFSADCILALVRERISALLKLPIAAMEPPQIFHYDKGQELKPHVDYLQRGERAPGAYQGDRIATFLLYLSDDFDGGETWFPRADLKVKVPKGDALYFANVDGEGVPDPMTLHAGLPPLRGEKWLLSQWIHDRPFGR